MLLRQPSNGLFIVQDASSPIFDSFPINTKAQRSPGHLPVNLKGGPVQRVRSPV